MPNYIQELIKEEQALESYVGKSGEERKRLIKQHNQARRAILNAMANDCGVFITNPKREILINMAWQNGHAYGYESVYNEMKELSKLVTK